METKTWSASGEKIQKGIDIRSRFGWELVGRTGSSFSMKRENSPKVKKLKSLEKQYNYISRKAPVGGIVWIVIGLILLGMSFLLKDWDLNYLIYIPCAICLIIGFFVILTFFILKPYCKKMIVDIFLEADEIVGKSKNYPIKVNLREGDIHSYEIKKAVYNHIVQVK